ncbi:hypothetical protein FRC00_003932 [Tulasnella sp. 408]|nr:hypothetical protein FRC00_003932 [Tulasnella sp. 408]
MSSTTATVDVGLITVVNSERATSHTLTPSFPPFPPRKFVCSPGNHGLPRTALKAVGDESRFLAVMDALSCRIQGLSLSEPPACQATGPAGGSVNIETRATPADSTDGNASFSHKVSNCRPAIFSKYTQNAKARFKRMALKAGGKAKKARGASRPQSQCSPQVDPCVGQTVESVPGHSMLEALEANQHPQVSRFYKISAFEGRPDQGVGDLTFSPRASFGISPSNLVPAVETTGLFGIPMEDVQQPSSLHPTSPGPIPMEVEAGLPSGNTTLAPEPQEPLVEPPVDRDLDAPVTDSSDTIMGDSEEDVSRATEVMQQTEATSRTLVDPYVPSSFPTTRTAVNVSLICSVSTERVPSTSLNQDVDMEDADNSRSFTSLQCVLRPLAALVWILTRDSSLRQASTPLPPAVRNEASEEAEAKAFFAQLKTSRPPVKFQPKPTPPPRSSEPKKTKGSAARSLMDDIMAGFRSATKGKPSQQQVAMAVDPPAQPRPVATTTHHASLAALPKPPRRNTPVVAGRQPGPQPTAPHHVGTGSEATAPGGSLILSSEAPSTVPTFGKVSGPSAGNQVRGGFASGAAPSGTASGAAMDGVESGRRVVKGSRRVVQAIARTGWTLETAQQRTREAQVAQDVEHNIEVAPPPASSLRAFEERAKSSAWHASQPPPPPEAMPYIGVGKKFRRSA